MRVIALIAIIVISITLLSDSYNHVNANKIDIQFDSRSNHARLSRRHGGDSGVDRNRIKRSPMYSLNSLQARLPQGKPPTKSTTKSSENLNNAKGDSVSSTTATPSASTSPQSAGSGGSSTNVPTGTFSTNAIISICVAGGVVLFIIGLLMFIHKKKRKEMTDNIVATSAAAWEQQSNSYEKMEEEAQPIATCTVIATYTPTLDDELNIKPGDTVTILMEYDDGWVQGINETQGGTKGVFPRHCVDMNIAFSNKRSSSIGGYMVVDLN